MEKETKEIPFCFVDSTSVINWILVTGLEAWRETQNENNQVDWHINFEKIKRVKCQIGRRFHR
jgi:hypothetical protein